MALLERGRDKVFAGVLVVVVIGALGSLAWSLFRSDGDGGRPDGWFHCTKCGHE